MFLKNICIKVFKIVSHKKLQSFQRQSDDNILTMTDTTKYQDIIKKKAKENPVFMVSYEASPYCQKVQSIFFLHNVNKNFVIFLNRIALLFQAKKALDQIGAKYTVLELEGGEDTGSSNFFKKKFIQFFFNSHQSKNIIKTTFVLVFKGSNGLPRKALRMNGVLL